MNLDRAFGLGTAGGALALADAVPSASAKIVDRVGFLSSPCLLIYR